MASTTSLAKILAQEQKLVAEWTTEFKNQQTGGSGRISEDELKAQSRSFIKLLAEAAAAAQTDDINREAWAPLREFLDDISRTRAIQGFTSDQTATFIFSFKKPVLAALREAYSSDAKALGEETWVATELLDKLGLHAVRAYQKAREQVIERQQQELLELSTPVVKLWDGILALPMIGTLDSARTQVVMESLLQRIVDTGSEIAIIDITGVPTVDTLVAQHLLKTVAAIRLLGAECIISGVRPQIAQTIVHLGVDLTGVTTKANLADALSLALKRSGFSVIKSNPDARKA
jgi:rsbT co-antagonist protein RsbR